MQNAPNHFTLCAFHWQNRSGEAKSRENRSGSTARMWQLAPPLESSMCSENWCESKGVSPMTRSFTFPASYAAKSAAIITRTVLLNSHCHRTLNHNEGNTTKIKKECDAFVSCEFLSTPASHAGATRTALGCSRRRQTAPVRPMECTTKCPRYKSEWTVWRRRLLEKRNYICRFNSTHFQAYVPRKVRVVWEA